ncbi:MAG: phenylalanine--tRNA ligase subunit beta, partial [Candidatus Dasytiphilus stammeri]
MKLSEAWLREWVNPDIDTETLAEQLTLSGLAVENVITVAGNYCAKEDVVVGKIIECKPLTRNLSTTRVHIGERVLNIVCGAENCRKDLKVAVSRRDQHLNSDNCSLPDHKSNSILTITSEGKLCSFADLGLPDNHLHNDYIIELPTSAPLGMNIRDYLQLDDKIIEINVPPNRADCLSICGIAREIAARNKLQFKERIITFQKIRVEDILPIRVEVSEACPRYLARLLKDINVNVPTPLWIREKLRRCDMISDNIVMDIHNYILIELGQPIQVYDRKIIDGSIIVRMAHPDERLVLKNGYPAKLKSNTLVVADNNQVLALAGIIGGQRSMVHSNTTDILLESSFYSPEFIIGRAGHYGLHTPASHRYERGIDPLIQYKAIEMATELLHNICGGQVGPLIDVTNPILVPKGISIILRRKKIDLL